MSQWPSSNQGNPIRISAEDAYAPHVDDLLKRQMNLRGEPGITRDHKRHWYYQNWFVFMLAGALAAVAAWAILEPFFDDLLYVQGPIQQINMDEPLPRQMGHGSAHIELKADGRGWIRINDEQIRLLDLTRLLDTDGNVAAFQPTTLKVGDEVGMYVEYLDAGAESLALAIFVVRDPPAPPSGSAAPRSLRQLNARSDAAGMLLFPVLAAFIGLAIGAADGFICRMPRRVILAGAIGLLAGFIGGFVSSIIAGLVYAPLNALAAKQSGDTILGLSTFGFLVQMGGRSLAWSMAGMAIGLGQGIALRSGRLLLYGFLGGIVGGLLGGLLFDPIDLLLLGVDKPSAHVSRLIGFMVIGASVGAMIGVVELLARDAWLRMTEGPLAGKEFLIFKDTMKVGASPRSDVYLFNDRDVMPLHAVVRAVGDNYEIDSQSRETPVFINGRPVPRARLHHGDRITIGRTSFVFQKRRG